MNEKQPLVGQLNTAVKAAVGKKTHALNQDTGRYCVRAILAGVYLALGTAFSGMVGNVVNEFAPGLGGIVFAFLFGFGLFFILCLGGELATSNMMYMTFGATNKWVSWGRGFYLIVLVTLLNLVGAIIIGALLATTSRFSGMDAGHLLATASEAKLTKSPLQQFSDGILANFLVNMGVVIALFTKDFTSRLVAIITTITIFVAFGLEHVIANFCLFALVFFSMDTQLDARTLSNVAINWIVVFFGNLVGGGLIFGGIYACLNRGSENYRD